MMRIVALIVTYKRQDLLKKCIDGVKKQSYGVLKLVVFDNENSQRTREMCSQDDGVIYMGSNTNLGGAGGFVEGMKYAMKNLSPDAIWMMDDDVYPTENALLNLHKCMIAAGEECAFTLSKVYNQDDTESLNAAPFVRRNYGADTCSRLEDQGMIRVETGTFVSVLINSKWISRVGYPLKEFFIYYDDLEYLHRLHNFGGRGYHCRESKVYHDSKIENIVDFFLLKRPIFIYKKFLRNRAYYQLTFRGKLSLPSFIKYTLSSDFRTISQSEKLNLKLKIRYLSYLFFYTLKGFFFHPSINDE
jgi:GT2 family glycosyltransferase